MGIVFDLENSKSSSGHMVSNGGCVCPLSLLATDELLLTIEYINKLGDSTTLNTPTVSGVPGTLRASTTGTSTYSFAGATIGTALFTFSSNPASFRAFFVKISGQKSSSPYSAGYSAITSGLSHQIIAGSTAPFLGAVIFGAIGLSGLPSIFEAGVGFDSPDSIFNAYEEFNYNPNDGTFAPIFALNVAIRYAEEAGDTGALVWSSIGWNYPVGPFAVPGGIAAFWISPLQAPSAPRVLTPVANLKATSGSTQRISYEGATDPNVDSEDLIYKIYLSNNQGISFDTLLHTTLAGELSWDWDTTGFVGNFIVKVVASNGTDDGEAGYSGAFQLFADTAPGAPTDLRPSGYISQAAKTFTWVAVNPDFDTQSDYELEWSTNADMSGSSTTGTVTSTTSSHAFSASTDILTPVGTKYWRVRTKGAVDGTFGAWSAKQTVIVSAAPGTPTITSSSTATTAIWPVTFTAIAHTQFRHRWILFGEERFNGIVQSSGFSFTSPFNLANGDVWTVKVSVFDPVTGLESAEASQTLTVTYTGPNAATLEVTALSSIGAMQIAITNSDSVDHVRIYRSLNGNDFVLISPKLEGSATYLDYQVAHDLDTVLNEYSYKARSFKPTTLGYTDSAPSDGVGIQLSQFHISVVDKLSTTANASLSVAIPIEGNVKKRFVKKHVSVGNKGRTKFITRAGQAKHTELIYNCKIARGDTTTFLLLQAVFNANKTLCIREQAANFIFGKILVLPKVDSLSDISFSLTCIECEHQEEQAR